MGVLKADCPFAICQWNWQSAAPETSTPATEVTSFRPQGLLSITSLKAGMCPGFANGVKNPGGEGNWGGETRPPLAKAPQGIYGLRGQPAAPSASSNAMIPTSIRRMVAWV